MKAVQGILDRLLLLYGWKRCTKCGGVKPPTAFPFHNKKGGLRRSICKDCHNAACREYRKKKREADPAWCDKERKRNRKKWNEKYAGKEYGNKTRDEIRADYEARYPEKHAAGRAVANAGMRPNEGHHLHHWSYRVCDQLDCLHLPKRDHALLHRHMTYDADERLYRRKDNNALLDTRESHTELLKELKA